MEFPKTNKKIKYVIVGEIVVDADGREARDVESVLDTIREIGEAEIVDVSIIGNEDDES